MGLIYDSWLWLWNQISPQVDSRQIEDILAEARQSLPTPVFWTLGKVQQGKTSIIRALTGRNDAEIGKGFRACTHTSRVYAYPDDEGCFLKFLDTRGLGEVGYDPAEDIEVFADQSHCIIVVLKAMDHAQQDVLHALRAIRKHRPQWPVIVCQTTLHEGYPGGVEHIVPYAYDQDSFSEAVPSELARSLAAQRGWFDDEPVRFVPLDFTFADHGQRVYEPADYGLDALWEAWKPPCRLACVKWSATTSRSASGCTTRISMRPILIFWSMRRQPAARASFPFRISMCPSF